MKIDDLIRRVVDDKRTALLLDRKQGSTKVAEVTSLVLADPALARSMARIKEDPFELGVMCRRFIRTRVAGYMRGAKYVDSGIRQWEVVRHPGQAEGHWMPTRGMMVWQWRNAGNAKVRQGSDTLREGRLLLAMVEDAKRRGYKDDDVVRNDDFAPIVKAAKLRVA